MGITATIIEKLKGINSKQEVEYWRLLRKTVAKGEADDKAIETLLNHGRAYGYTAEQVTKHITDMAEIVRLQPAEAKAKAEWDNYPQKREQMRSELAEARKRIPQAKKAVEDARAALVAIEAKVSNLADELRKPLKGEKETTTVNPLGKDREYRYDVMEFAEYREWLSLNNELAPYKKQYPLAFE